MTFIRFSRRIVLYSLVSIAVALATTLTASTYLRRYCMLFLPDVYDYQKLPYRAVRTGPQAFLYPASSIPVPSSIHYGGQIVDRLEGFLEQHATTAFLVIKDGKLVYERYFNGHARDTLCKSFSVTKSFISALIGIAIDEGCIRSVDDPIQKYLPELRRPGTERLNIRQCLLGTTGIRFRRGSFPWDEQPKWYYSPDLRHLLLTSLEFERQPGEAYTSEEYGPQLLAFILERVSGMTISRYLEEKLWKPLGMEYPALWVIDSEGAGMENASGLTARPIDFAKFGHLFLRNGSWGNRQVISQSWITESTVRDRMMPGSLSWPGGWYKYIWWCYERGDSYDYSANGHFSQRIYVAPRSNAVVVRFGTDAAGIDWNEFIKAFIDAL